MKTKLLKKLRRSTSKEVIIIKKLDNIGNDRYYIGFKKSLKSPDKNFNYFAYTYKIGEAEYLLRYYRRMILLDKLLRIRDKRGIIIPM